MPVTGVYLSAENFSGIARLVIPDDAVWSFEVGKLRSACFAAPEETLTVSFNHDGTVEWHGLKGLERAYADRSERVGTMSMMPSKQFSDAGRVLGDLDPTCRCPQLVAAFKCQGCEPLQALSVGPVTIENLQGERVHIDQFDFNGSWVDSNGACLALEASFGPVQAQTRSNRTAKETPRQSKQERKRGSAAHHAQGVRNQVDQTSSKGSRCSKAAKQQGRTRTPAVRLATCAQAVASPAPVAQVALACMLPAAVACRC